MVASEIWKYENISGFDSFRKSDLSREYVVTFETEISEEIVAVISLSFGISEQIWIGREFFFSHAKGK